MERIYCKYCGAKLKKDFCGLICPEDYTHENNEVINGTDTLS